MIAEAFHFPRGRSKAIHSAALSAELRQDGEGWSLDLSAGRFVQSVVVEAEGFLPSDSWFHLPPGGVKSLRLTPRSGADPVARPAGEVRGLGAEAVISF